MTILQRATGLLTSNVHEWIDRWEDPERMLRQLIRELEESADLAMDATAMAIAHERLLERQLAALRQEDARLRDRARAAVIRGDDESARAAIAARQRHQAFLDACESQHTRAAHEAARSRRELDGLRSRLSEARQTMHLYVARERIARARRAQLGCTPSLSRTPSQWGRFDRICERIDRADAESAALLELLEESNDVEPLFDDAVDRELEELKKSAVET